MVVSQSTGLQSRRRVGVLLHPTALPGSPICGGLGVSARQWIHALVRHGIAVWQVLPLAPPDGTGSPYSSPSSFALNPWLLDATDLVDEGFLSRADAAALPGAGIVNPRLDFQLAQERQGEERVQRFQHSRRPQFRVRTLWQIAERRAEERVQ